MAITVTRVSTIPETANYDRAAGRYTIERVYLVSEAEPATAVGLQWGTGADQFPDTFTITHTDGSTTITMKGVERRVKHYKPAESESGAYTEVIVVYEGHVLGVVSDSLDLSGKTEAITLDLDTLQGIGPKMEGTNRTVPNMIWRIIQNVGENNYRDQLMRAHRLTGTVNEDYWLDPGLVAPNAYWPEGCWLYLGAQVQRNRDGTYTFTHQFDYDGTNQHKFAWRYYRDDIEDQTINGQTVKRIKRTFGPEIKSKIYPVAGTDVTDTFEDLFSI